MVAYATRRDVYTYGLPRGALGNPGRLVASSIAATDSIELIEHGFDTDDAVTFRATDGGVLSSPLVAGTVYYAIPLTDSTFQVSATPSGSAIDLTTDGVSMVVSIDLPFDQLLEYYSRFVDGFLPAHAVPLTAPYPVTVVAIVATLVAKKAQILSGLISESMRDTELSAKAQLERWATGIPARDAAVTTVPTNLSVVKANCDRFIGSPLFGGRGFPSDNGGI